MLNQAAVLRHVLTPREIKLALTAGEPIWQRRSADFCDLLFSRGQIARPVSFARIRSQQREGEEGDRNRDNNCERERREIRYSVGFSVREVASR